MCVRVCLREGGDGLLKALVELGSSVFTKEEHGRKMQSEVEMTFTQYQPEQHIVPIVFMCPAGQQWPLKVQKSAKMLPTDLKGLQN